MIASTILTIHLCLFSCLFNVALAAPPGNPLRQTGLVQKRTPGESYNDPKYLDIDITGWEDSAEFNCWAMLCRFGGERIWQHVLTSSERDSNYQQSGASLHPFRDDQLERRGTAQITPETTSAEEFPWESMHRGGGEAFVFPTTLQEQHVQGGHLPSSRQGPNHVGDGEWIHITYVPPRLFKRYCSALMVEPPQTPDFSVCREDKEQTLFGKAVKLTSFVYKRRPARSGNQAFRFDPVSRSAKRSPTANVPEDSEKREDTT